VPFEYSANDLANGFKIELMKVKTYVMQTIKRRRKTKAKK